MTLNLTVHGAFTLLFDLMAIKSEKPFLSLTREEKEEDDVPLTGGGPKKDHTRKTLVTVGIFRGLVPVCVVNDYARGGGEYSDRL